MSEWLLFNSKLAIFQLYHGKNVLHLKLKIKGVTTFESLSPFWSTNTKLVLENLYYYWARILMFNTTFNSISVISWRSVVLVEETEVPIENHWPVASHSQIWSHNVVSSIYYFKICMLFLVNICTKMYNLRNKYRFFFWYQWMMIFLPSRWL